MSGVYLYLGNNQLKPQSSNYYSIGGEYNIDALSISVTGYYNAVNNMIALTTINNTEYNQLSAYSQEKIVSYDPVKVRMAYCCRHRWRSRYHYAKRQRRTMAA